MNLLLLYPHELQGTHAMLSGIRLQEVQGRFDLRRGDTVVAGVLNGSIGRAHVEQVSDENIRLACSFDRPPPLRQRGEFVVGLSRPQTVKKVLHFAATFGIERLRLVRCERSEKSYLDAHILRQSELEAELDLGLSQSVDTVRPEVTVHYSLEAALRAVEQLKPQTGEPGLFYGAVSPSVSIPERRSWESCCLVVGPEGGLTAQEIGLLSNAGFTAASLGPRQQRVEFALAQLAPLCFSLV